MFYYVYNTDILTRFFDDKTISHNIIYLISANRAIIHLKIHKRHRIFIGPRVGLMRLIVISHIIFICIYFRPPGFVRCSTHSHIIYILQAAVDGRRMMSFNPLPRIYTTDYIYNAPLKCTHNNNNNNKEESCKMTNSPYKG